MPNLGITSDRATVGIDAFATPALGAVVHSELPTIGAPVRAPGATEYAAVIGGRGR